MTLIEQDIFTNQEGILIQVVNNKRVFGAGLAAQTAQRFPKVKERYMDNHNPVLGDILVVEDYYPLTFILMYAQDGYGNSYKTKVRYLQYHSFHTCLIQVREYFEENSNGRKILIPYRIGCGYAGGNWSIVKHILTTSSLNYYLEDDNYDIYKKQ